MGKQRRSRKPQRAARGRSDPARSGRRRKPLRWRRLGRRILVAVAILVLPALVVGLEVRDNLRRSDLSVIGSGTPVVVQAHDPECPGCRALLDNAEAAHADSRGDVAFRVIHLNTREGRAFAREFDVGKVTLVVFDRDGEVEDILRGVRSVEQLRRLFADLAGEPTDAS